MKRKGRKHQPKVGTPREQNYARHQSERAVVGNFGVHGNGAKYWIAVVLIVAIVAVSLLVWILFL